MHSDDVSIADAFKILSNVLKLNFQVPRLKLSYEFLYALVAKMLLSMSVSDPLTFFCSIGPHHNWFSMSSINFMGVDVSASHFG